MSPATEPGDAGAEPDFGRFVAPVRRHPAVFALVLLAVVAAGASAYGVLSTSASARFEVDVRPDPAAAEIESVAGGGVGTLLAPPQQADVLAFFTQQDLTDDLGLDGAASVAAVERANKGVLVTVTASSTGEVEAALAGLIAGYEETRRSELTSHAEAAVGAVTERLAVIDAELGALEGTSPDSLLDRSVLVREKAALTAGLGLLSDFMDRSNLGIAVDVVDPPALVEAALIARLVVGGILAVLVVTALTVAWSLADKRIRRRADLERAAPGVELVGLLERGETSGLVAVARRLAPVLAGEPRAGIEVVASAGAVGEMARELGEALKACGIDAVVTAHDATDLRSVLDRDGDPALALVVADWGRSRVDQVRRIVLQLTLAWPDRVACVVRDVPASEVPALVD